MKIKCIDNTGVQGQLNENQEYTPVKETEKQYKIKLGNGVTGTYLKVRFEVVEN
jgi:hypothetical protein